MTVFFATLKVKSGKEAEFEKLQQELSKLTHEQEPDTIVYDVIRHREKPGIYAVYARFKDEAAFQTIRPRPSTTAWSRRSSTAWTVGPRA